jgi:lipoate-protein ligase B
MIAMEILNLGMIPFAEALALQKQRQAEVLAAAADEALFLCEHPPVVTAGRGAEARHLLVPPEELARLGYAFHATDRGGSYTCHGPGQLVAYPILHLKRRGLGLSGYLRGLEKMVIRLLAGFGVRADLQPGFTGVWTRQAKIAAIGIQAKNWVTSHGAAVNVSMDLDLFRVIVPCGLEGKTVTSLEKELGRAPGMDAVADSAGRIFEEIFYVAENLNHATP